MDGTIAAWIVLPGLLTALGALGLVFIHRPSDRLLDAMVAFTGGIMLAATIFSLLLPALDAGPLLQVVIGLSLGFVLMAVLDWVVPHLHHLRPGATPTTLNGDTRPQSLLMLSAMTIHNIPEGLAVGVAFGAGGTEYGIPVALAIGIQNIPEGFAAGAPLARVATRRAVPVLVAAATGIVEPIAGFIGYLAVDAVSSLLATSLSFAAGAMFYVIVDELVPDSHAHGNERIASFGLFIGFVIMLVLDVSLS